MARTSEQDGSTGTTGKAGESGGVIRRLRARAAQLIRLGCTLIAALLAVGVLLIALRHNINDTNPIVKFVTGFDDAVDGPFSRSNGIVAFAGKDAATKEALVNWGIAAVVYLVIGRVLGRLVRP